MEPERCLGREGKLGHATVFDEDDVIHLLKAAVRRVGDQTAFAKRQSGHWQAFDLDQIHDHGAWHSEARYAVRLSN